MHTLVCIPTYNERESLPNTLKAIFEYSPEVEVLVIDDGSPDGTADWAEKLGDDRVHVMRRTAKEGLGPAYVAGFTWALAHDYDVICQMDADGSHRGRDLPLLLEAVRGGAELAIGSRWVRGGEVVNWPLNRNILSRGANLYANVAIGLHVADATAGFRAYSRNLLQRIDLAGVQSHGYGFQIDMTVRARRAGARIVEVPIIFVERELGASKMSGSIIGEAFVNVARWGLQRRSGQVRRLLGR